jgi:hypothetical protein
MKIAEVINFDSELTKVFKNFQIKKIYLQPNIF